ncbi:hypothetical protein [Stieleria varia]|uniref:Uncharacterized protein n=1 Tax=Stieleria varia TaxID=2528005 RepID=A0A5C5ZZW4_9BACT|nr:hypothetical protein [Stieleria varia]TWT92675.1 hypothetical protein Pla52n_60400 [Stieleria varia]
MKIESITWTFVCQAGRLEREASVLAASLRQFLGPRAHLIATLPHSSSVTHDDAFESITPAVRAFLQELGVRLTPQLNPLLKSPGTLPDLLMNKAYALKADPAAKVVVFLDSDQLCHGVPQWTDFAVPFYGRAVFFSGAAAMQGLWEQAYEACEVTMPNHRIVVRKRDGTHPPIVCPAYFNSGFQAVHQPWIEPFVQQYVDCYQRLKVIDLLGEARYFTEQVAMAIAVAKVGIPYQMDTQRINESFRHYYSTSILASLPQHSRLVRQLCQVYPPLLSILQPHSEWDGVLSADHSTSSAS